MKRSFLSMNGIPNALEMDAVERNRPAAGCAACGTLQAPPIVYRKWGYPIKQCPTCQLGSTGLDEQQFDPAAVYSSDYFSGKQTDGYADYVGSEVPLRQEFRSALNALRRVGRHTGRLFEIGCAYGFFLSEASRAFQVSGIEPCTEAAAYCRTQGLDVDTGFVNDSSLAARQPLDTVVLLDVIEHLSDPLGVLQMAHRNMVSGAHILITTGDWGSFLSRITGSKWRLMTPPQHVYFFSPKTIRLILSRAGFRVIRIEKPWKKVPVSLILFQLARLLGLTPKRIPGLSRLALPLNLFDAMRVIAMKDP